VLVLVLVLVLMMHDWSSNAAMTGLRISVADRQSVWFLVDSGERLDLDTRIGSLGHGQFDAARHRFCGSSLPCSLARRVRGRLNFGNRPEAAVHSIVASVK
jgi:hypothetical protein